MQAEPELKDIQAWLHTFVVEPGSQDDALAAAEKMAGFDEGSAESLILPSPTLEPRERIQIYRGMYLLRMQEALQIDFPAVEARVGEERFFELVGQYVERHPSQSYTLDHLGRKFSDFLREVNANEEGDFLSELAYLEWSLCMAAIAHDSPTLYMTDLASVTPDNFVNLILEPIPALEFMTFQHDVNGYFKAWSDEEQMPPVSVEECHLAVWRNELNVWRMNLTPSAHFFLGRLTEGLRLGEALDLAIDNFETDEEDLFDWFQTWVSEGFFSTFRVARGTFPTTR